MPLTSTTAPIQLCNLLQAFLTLFVSIGKCYCYPCLQFIFSVAQFCWSFIQPCPHIIIKRNSIWGVRLPDVRSNVVTEKLFDWQFWLSSAACVAWYRVLLPDVGSYSSYSLDSGQDYLLQTLDVGLFVECGGR